MCIIATNHYNEHKIIHNRGKLSLKAFNKSRHLRQYFPAYRSSLQGPRPHLPATVHSPPQSGSLDLMFLGKHFELISQFSAHMYTPMGGLSSYYLRMNISDQFDRHVLAKYRTHSLLIAKQTH